MFVLNGQFRTPIYKGQVGNFTGQSSPQNCRVPFKVGGGGREGCREGAGRGQGGGSDMLGAWGAGKGAGRWFGVQGREGCREVQGGAGRCREVQGGGSGCREVRGCRDVRGVQ